jgi:hypothetical protein
MDESQPHKDGHDHLHRQLDDPWHGEAQKETMVADRSNHRV